MPIVVNINLSARIRPRAAQALRRAGYQIEEFEEISDLLSLTGEVMEGAYGDRLLLGLENNLTVVLSRGEDEYVAIGTFGF